MKPFISISKELTSVQEINGWIEPMSQFIQSECSKLTDEWIEALDELIQLGWIQSADEWLQEIKDKTIAEQLKESKIKEVHIKFIFAHGLLKTDGDGFFVFIYPELGIEEKMLTLGHEIGHTFHMDLTKNPPDDLYSEKDSKSKFFHLVELFCEEFGKKWVAINGKEKVEAFLDTKEKAAGWESWTMQGQIHYIIKVF